MKKKVLLFVLTIISIIAIGAVSASAASESDLTYEINYWGQAVITGCNKDASGELVIPSSYEGYPVNNIESEAFAGCSGLTSITIPDTVTWISSDAFKDCTGLTSIHITDIKAWCDILFGGGTNPLQYAGNLYLNGELVTDLVLPDNVEEISDYAFYGCTSLKSITIPDSVTYIGSDAFNDCTNFTRVNITDINAWLNIEFGYFSGNPLYTAGNLYLNGELVTELNISDDIDEIKDYAFTGCTSLESVTIPGSVTSIGYKAFDGCSNLTKATIAEGVTSIGTYAFSSSGLTSIVIPDSVTDMGTHVFYICTNLTDATIGNGVTTIGNSTFCYCNLESISIGSSVTNVEDWAFYDCYNLKSVYITDIKAWCNIDFEYEDRNPLYYGAKLYLNGELVTNLVLPEDLKEIKCCAFSGCSSLKSVTIPDSVTSIGYEAFRNCTNLNNITIPNSVTSIGNVAFAYCGSLKKVYYKGTEADWKEISISDGNEPLTDATINYIACTKTDISDDGKTFSITPKNIENGKTVILALYDTDKFVEAKILTYTGDTIPFSTDKTYTKARVMVWSNIADIEPVCTVENVK